MQKYSWKFTLQIISQKLNLVYNNMRNLHFFLMKIFKNLIYNMIQNYEIYFVNPYSALYTILQKNWLHLFSWIQASNSSKNTSKTSPNYSKFHIYAPQYINDFFVIIPTRNRAYLEKFPVLPLGLTCVKHAACFLYCGGEL